MNKLNLSMKSSKPIIKLNPQMDNSFKSETPIARTSKIDSIFH